MLNFIAAAERGQQAGLALGESAQSVLAGAAGLVFLTTVKAGLLLSGTLGSGVAVGRRAGGGWSAPTAVMVAGSGWGLQLGGEVTDSLVVLQSRDAVDALCASAQLSLSGSASATAGGESVSTSRQGLTNERTAGVPAGASSLGGLQGTSSRSGAAGASRPSGASEGAPVSRLRSFTRSRGLYAGASLETGLVVSRPDLNRKFYGRDVSVRALLCGSHPPPRAAEGLYAALATAGATAGGATPSAGPPGSPHGEDDNPFGKVASSAEQVLGSSPFVVGDFGDDDDSP